MGFLHLSGLIILIYIFVGILNPILIEFATGTYCPRDMALNFWIISIILRNISVWIIIYTHYIILEYKEFQIIPIPIIIISIVVGLIFSLLFTANPFQIIQKGDRYFFFLNNALYLGILISFDIISILFLCIIQVRNFSRIRYKRLATELNVILVMVSSIIITHGIFNLTQVIYFWQIHILLFLIGGFLVLYIVLKRPEVFTILTNKLYEFIVFHKSGILLYSYNFATGKEKDESVVKGTILIGINHILSNLTERRSLLNLIKMPHRDILLEYNSNLGCAVMLITNQINSVLERSLGKFMKSFSEKNRRKFEKMNGGLIDVSEFKETKQLLKKYFEAYLPQSFGI
ncbi:MAG: hypothetical protein R6U96_00015 [Promethearchaeia archaeon]